MIKNNKGGTFQICRRCLRKTVQDCWKGPKKSSETVLVTTNARLTFTCCLRHLPQEARTRLRNVLPLRAEQEPSADPWGTRLARHPCTCPPHPSFRLNISFKTDGMLILAASRDVLSRIHFPIGRSPSSSSFFLPRRSGAPPPPRSITQLSFHPLFLPVFICRGVRLSSSTLSVEGAWPNRRDVRQVKKSLFPLLRG